MPTFDFGQDSLTNPFDLGFDNGLGGQGGFSGDLGNGQGFWDSGSALGQNPFGTPGIDNGGMANQGTGSSGMNLGQMIGLGTAGVTALTGLAGVIQKAMAGDLQSQQVLQRTIQQASPQEQQAIAQAIQGLQQQMSLGGQTQGIINQQSQGRIPGQQQSQTIPGQQAPFQSGQAQALGQGFGQSQELMGQGQDLVGLAKNIYSSVLGRPASDQEAQAWAQTGNAQSIISGILGSQEFSNRGIPLNQAISNLYQGVLGRQGSAAEVGQWQQQLGAPDVASSQLGIPAEVQAQQGAFNQLGNGTQAFNQFSGQSLPILQQMLQGGLNLNGEVNRTVEQAFQPQLGNIATQAIESARRRGFAGGAELLQQGPAGAIAGPALSDLQGQMAAAKLGLAQGLPMQAIGGFGQLQNLNQQLVQSLGGFGQQGINNRNTTQGVQQGGLGQLGQIGGVLGQQRQGQINQTTNTNVPGGGLLGAAQNLGQIGQGVGNVLDIFGRQQAR